MSTRTLYVELTLWHEILRLSQPLGWFSLPKLRNEYQLTLGDPPETWTLRRYLEAGKRAGTFKQRTADHGMYEYKFVGHPKPNVR